MKEQVIFIFRVHSMLPWRVAREADLREWKK